MIQAGIIEGIPVENGAIFMNPILVEHGFIGSVEDGSVAILFKTPSGWTAYSVPLRIAEEMSAALKKTAAATAAMATKGTA